MRLLILSLLLFVAAAHAQFAQTPSGVRIGRLGEGGKDALYAIAAVFLLLALVIGFAGLRFLRTMVGIIASLIAFNFFWDLLVTETDWSLITVFIVVLVIAIVIAILAVWLLPCGVIVLGGFSGVVIALWVLALLGTSGSSSPPGWLAAVIIGAAAVVGVLCVIFLARPFVIIYSSIAGAYQAVAAVDLIIATASDGTHRGISSVVPNYLHGTVLDGQQISTWVWLEIGIFILLAMSMAVVQFMWTAPPPGEDGLPDAYCVTHPMGATTPPPTPERRRRRESARRRR